MATLNLLHMYGDGINARHVASFIEKPDAQTAKELIGTGHCYWNAGIFVFKASVFLQMLHSLQPEIHESTWLAVEGCTRDLGFLRLGPSSFSKSVNLSVDYAVMEQAGNVVALPFASD